MAAGLRTVLESERGTGRPHAVERGSSAARARSEGRWPRCGPDRLAAPCPPAPPADSPEVRRAHPVRRQAGTSHLRLLVDRSPGRPGRAVPGRPGRTPAPPGPAHPVLDPGQRHRIRGGTGRVSRGDGAAAARHTRRDGGRRRPARGRLHPARPHGRPGVAVRRGGQPGGRAHPVRSGRPPRGLRRGGRGGARRRPRPRPRGAGRGSGAGLRRVRHRCSRALQFAPPEPGRPRRAGAARTGAAAPTCCTRGSGHPTRRTAATRRGRRSRTRTKRSAPRSWAVRSSHAPSC